VHVPGQNAGRSFLNPSHQQGNLPAIPYKNPDKPLAIHPMSTTTLRDNRLMYHFGMLLFLLGGFRITPPHPKPTRTQSGPTAHFFKKKLWNKWQLFLQAKTRDWGFRDQFYDHTK
jgi:hypothetical protein